MTLNRFANRSALIAVIAAVALATGAMAATASPAEQPAVAAKKKKKCNRGYKKSGKKCVRRTLKVASVNLVVAVVKDGKVKITGWSDFGYTTKYDAFLSGKIIVTDGVGKETIKANWFVAKGQNFTNFTGSWKVGLNKSYMTIKMVVGDVTSNMVVDDK